MDRIVIFGCGPTGLRIYKELKNDNEILAFFDNDEAKAGSSVEGIPVYKPEKKLLEHWTYDYIVAASVYGKWQMKEQLQRMGVPDDKIRFHARMQDVFTPFLKNLAEDFREENIIGACAEVGVFRGESACKINKYFPDRELHLYDTFEGFAADDIEKELHIGRRDVKAGQFGDTSIDIVMENMEHPERVIIHQGYFPDTAKGLDKKFCFVRIDMDLYVPTKAALEIFEPLMVRGGVMLVHDYFGSQYPGIKKAVKEFMAEHSQLRKIPIGDAMSIAIMGFQNGGMCIGI